MRALIIDGGGTSTEVGVSINGQIAARTLLPSARPTRADQQTDELCRMIGSFLATTVIDEDFDGGLDVVIVGMAGVWTPRERHTYAASFKESWSVYVGLMDAQLVVMSDVELVHFASYGSSQGAVLIAGTGSIALMRDSMGTFHRSGGWGSSIDDAGSGTWLGQQACRAVARMLDGRGPATLLIRPVANFLRVDADYPDEVRQALRGAQLQRVSRIGAAVLTYADEGDAVAADIREAGARELALLCTSLTPDLEMRVTGYGSLLLNTTYTQIITETLNRKLTVLDDLLQAIPQQLR
jgi:N-acetylglucosamine kinase-like BadF-type ATPase